MIKREGLFAIVGMINYIVVIFLNAFTDLGHKIIIQNTIFKVYDGEIQIVLTAIVNALILLPFVLIYSPSGFLADKFAKSKIMEYAALFAVVITLVITYAYYHGLFFLAFAMTFLLALQSALYGPAKYGYIKELVGEKYISAGNAALQATTTVAILGGILFYTLFFESMYSDILLDKEAILQAVAPLGWLLVISSLIEWGLARRLPNTMGEASERTFRLKRYLRGAYLRKNLKTITRKKEIFEAVIALSLFWSISQVLLAVFGEYAKSELGITNTIFVQGVMALAGIGIILGSLLAANLSKYFINMGLVPFGAIGVTLILFLIPFSHSMVTLAILFLAFGVFSGFLMVPLNAKIQILSSRVHLGTILAGNNFIQNIFMFGFLSLTTLFAYYGMNAEWLLYMMTLVGIYLVRITLKRYLVETFWATMLIFSRLRHNYHYHGLENIPKKGAVLLLSNHVSWLDWIMIQLPIERSINFMMDKDIYHWPLFHKVFVRGEAIPISSRASKDAFAEAHRRLKQGKIVALFPEGGISADGEIGEFYRGYELIADDYEGVITPLFIDGIFGSSFSRFKRRKDKKRFFQRREIDIYYGAPLDTSTKHEALREVIIKMKEDYGR